MQVTFVRKATAILGWGVLAGSLFVTNLSQGNDDTTPPTTCPACCETGMSILARIPYISRLFKNSPAGDVEVLMIEDGFERIGVDFDFEFTAPTTSRPGIRLAEFAQDVCPSAKATCQSANHGTANRCEFAIPLHCDTAIGLSACDVTEQLQKIVGEVTVLTALSDVQNNLTEARSHLVESLAESEIAHQQERHELQLEIAKLKAKLKLQEEREKLKAEIVDLRQENTALQLQLVFSEKLRDTQLELTAAKSEVQRLTAMVSEQAKKLANNPADANHSTESKSSADIANRPARYETR